MIEQLTQIATSVFVTMLKSSSDERGTFRVLMTANIEGETKPLLLVGSAHPRIEDGDCIAILNPDKELCEEVTAGCAYNEALLRDIVGGKCDALVHLWIETYVKEGVNVIAKYKARTPSPAKFEVR